MRGRRRPPRRTSSSTSGSCDTSSTSSTSGSSDRGDSYAASQDQLRLSTACRTEGLRRAQWVSRENVLGARRSMALCRRIENGEDVRFFTPASKRVFADFAKHLAGGRIEVTEANATALRGLAQEAQDLALVQRCDAVRHDLHPPGRLRKIGSWLWRSTVSLMMRAYRGMMRIRLWWNGFKKVNVATNSGNVRIYHKRNPNSSNPPCLVIHGLGASSVEYANLLVNIDAREVIAVDLPGHGASDAPEDGEFTFEALVDSVAEALEKLDGDEPLTVFGNSLGGFVAVLLATRHPHLISRLVLSSPGGAPMSAKDFADLVACFRMQGRHEARTFVERIFADQPRFGSIYRAAVRNQFDNEVLQGVVQQARHTDLLSMDQLLELEAETVVYWGSEEKVLPYRHIDFWREGARRNRNHAIEVRLDEGTGHMPFFEDVERVVGWIHDVLGRDLGSASTSDTNTDYSSR